MKLLASVLSSVKARLITEGAGDTVADIERHFPTRGDMGGVAVLRDKGGRSIGTNDEFVFVLAQVNGEGDDIPDHRSIFCFSGVL